MNKEKEQDNKIKTEDTAPQIKEEETFIADNDEAINLVPIMSKSEVVVEKKKVKLNVSAILSIIAFLIISIIIIIFSTISKLQVEKAKSELTKQEQEVKGLSSKILSNDEILSRIYLYQNISSNQYSPKKIFEYFTKIASFDSNIQLNLFTFKSDTALNFEGEGDSLDTVARFWYLLSEDEKIKKVVLDSLSKSDQTVRFSFVITMVDNAFSSNNNLEN
ncbi:MAG TPA: hypothetical protein PLE51_03615 [Candidatus Pacearchaeota archaeon]|nr:hypothetical protein [Candidatus Pacearchaeota archaeon]